LIAGFLLSVLVGVFTRDNSNFVNFRHF
jgi:hypothetical protein